MITLPLTAFAVLSILASLLSQPSDNTAQGLSTATLILTNSDNGTTAKVSVGQRISVNLAGNVTTGYAWTLTSISSDSVATNGPMTYTVNQGGGTGVGGTFSFPFLAVKPGDATFGFEYRRAGDNFPAQTFTVTIHVTAVPPLLSISLIQASIVISWPIAGSTNFFLEGTPRFAPPQWSALNALPIAEGTNYTVKLGANGNGLYFRLRHL